MPRRAFTLIELLVVLTIIALLVGILVPVLASARSSAIGTLCLANQSQLVTGVHAHAADNRGHIPYGPEERDGGVSSGGDDFYVINGMATSLISDKFGTPVGAGLMLDDYIQETPEILFCPGTDQEVVASAQLAQVGTGSAISGYVYRHGSNEFLDLFEYRLFDKPMDTQTKVDDLGLNRDGDEARALFVDNNFLLAPGSFYYNLFHRSNHGESFVNIAYVDGHAEQRDNTTGRYSANIVGTNLYNAIGKMLDVLEEADRPD